MHRNRGSTGDAQNQRAEEPPTNAKRILHIVIEREKNGDKEPEIHAYYDKFRVFGDVKRIVKFRKNQPNNRQGRSEGSLQILIEMGDALSAQAATASLNGKNMFGDGEHTLRIDYSKLPELQVKSDNENRWDYERSARPNGKEQNMRGRGQHDGHGNMGHPHPQMGMHVPSHPVNMSWSQGPGGGIPAQNSASGDNRNTTDPMSVPQHNHGPGGTPPNQNGQINAASMHMNPSNFQPQGFPMGYPNTQMPMNLQNMTSYYTPQLYPPPMVVGPGAYFEQGSSRGVAQHPMNNGQMHQISQPMNYDTRSFNQQAMYYQHQVQPPVQSQQLVVCVSNLEQEKVKPDDLFTLFGVYGDVNRVKILYEKRETALIEFSQAKWASQAIDYLNNKKLYGKEMKLRLSKFQKVNTPKEGADTHNLTKEYHNNPLHRYRKAGSKNFLNVYAPCDVLHLSNIPEGKSEEEIRNIFEKHGTVKEFKWFKEKKMALIKLTNEEEAIHCLVKTHNHRMSANQHLRVSFSKGYLT